MRRGFLGLLIAFSLPLLAQTIQLNDKTLDSETPKLRVGKIAFDVEVRGVVNLRQSETWTVRNIAFVDGGQIVIRNNNLSLTVQGAVTATSGVPIIVAFPPNEKAPDGADGAPGRPGAPGGNGLAAGNVQLTFAQMPKSLLTLILAGQNGGNGGRGGRGIDGAAGSMGEAARSGGFNCLKAATPGQAGRPGGSGGAGGAAGACGRSGVLTLRGISPKLVDLRLNAASAGKPGMGGPGGSGGAGGAGGQGGGFCSAAPNGPNGAPGDRGLAGQRGETNCPPPLTYP